MKKILIICGEASGDLHAGNLVKRILEANPDIAIYAVGGEVLSAAGAEIIYDIKGLAVLGLFDALKKLPVFLSLRKLLLKWIKENKPGLVVFVDFSGFNLRFAKSLNNSVPAIYFISPQVWASRPGRVETIKKYISKMLVVFAFEKEFYKKYGLEVEFVGHPLLDIVAAHLAKEEFFVKHSLSPDKKTIALLPGSRKSEIQYNLPVMLKAAFITQDKLKDVQFLIAKSTQVDLGLYQDKIKGVNLDLRVIEGETYDCLNTADFALVASGTATLETAIMQKPFAVIYKMGLLNYLLYRPQVKLPYIGMVNIVAGKLIVPEFIQFKARPEYIAKFMIETLLSPEKLRSLQQELSSVKVLLGEKGASLRAAKIISDCIENRP
ncbi:MAG: lipid-A-disaccharide synthase [Candidatus Omnitrophota bacterium]